MRPGNALLLSCLAIALGCDGQVGVNIDSRSEATVVPSTVTPAGDYSVNLVAVSKQSVPNGWGDPINLVEIKNKKTGKTHLVAYHKASGHGETMIKLEEWTEGKANAH